MMHPRLSLAALALALLTTAARPAAAKPDSFACTQIMGVSVTGDWYVEGGFEKSVDDKKFQALWRKHAFVELWADPKNELWSVATTSPCADKASAPDRVVFTAVNWTFTKSDEWAGALDKVVGVIKAKYPAVKRIELLTMLRAPGNKSCGDAKTVVQPFVDEAVAKVAGKHPGLVAVGPKIEAPSCDVFTKGGPHFTKEGMAAVAKVYADHYGKSVIAQKK